MTGLPALHTVHGTLANGSAALYERTVARGARRPGSHR